MTNQLCLFEGGGEGVAAPPSPLFVPWLGSQNSHRENQDQLASSTGKLFLPREATHYLEEDGGASMTFLDLNAELERFFLSGRTRVQPVAPNNNTGFVSSAKETNATQKNYFLFVCRRVPENVAF
ncbi:MAG: hypothetical protein VYE07_01015 [Actinomycetota bacterium]|nr:hypothetical protein [Actinomycetota bacterium]